MFCRICGRQIDQNAVFCPYCGKKVEAGELPVQNPEAQVIACAAAEPAVYQPPVGQANLSGQTPQPWDGMPTPSMRKGLFVLLTSLASLIALLAGIGVGLGFTVLF